MQCSEGRARKVILHYCRRNFRFFYAPGSAPTTNAAAAAAAAAAHLHGVAAVFVVRDDDVHFCRDKRETHAWEEALEPIYRSQP